MSQQERPDKPRITTQKSKLELLEESLSSIIDDMSFSSHSHSAAILERNVSNTPLNTASNLEVNLEKQQSNLNLQTPIQSDFYDESVAPYNILKLLPQSMSNNTYSANFEQLLTTTGYSSYISDFHETGVTSLSELIRFATQYLPSELNVTPVPAPAPESSPSPFSYPNTSKNNTDIHQTATKQIKFTADDVDDDKQDEKEEKPERLSANRGSRNSYENDTKKEDKKKEIDRARTGRNKKHKLRLYEVEELLEDDVYCEYALLIRDGGNEAINGYYTCSGKKNDHYMFNHMNDNKAALYSAKNGTWMICYDDELLYGNPLKYDSIGGRDILLLSELNLYPPPPRCWYSIEGINPPPGVMWIEINENPMAFIDKEMAANIKEKNLNEIYMNKLKVDLPVQMIDFMFCGPIGFALRIDDTSKIMDVIRIKTDGQAKELGLKHGDTLLKINEEDISQQPQVAFPALKECVQSGEAFEVTFLRKKYDELIINVQRAGSPECNGKYVFLTLDEYDAPIFVKENDMKKWRILRLDHDDQEGQSIWGIQNVQEMNEYYIGISDTYSPPNNTWECIEEIGQNPAPGLQFISIDSNVLKKLVPDEPRIRQNIFVPTKRKRKKRINYNDDEDDNLVDQHYEFGDDEDDTKQAIVSLDSFKLQIEEQQKPDSLMTKTPDSMISNGSPFHLIGKSGEEPLVKKVSFNPSNLAKHTAMISGGAGSSPMFKKQGSAPMASRTDSIMSTASIYAIPDEVQVALSEYQNQIDDLQKELKQERKRALTLSHQHKTQKSILKEHEEKLTVEKEEFNKKMGFFRDELETVNQSYYQLWIKQSDTKLEYTKTNKESYKIKAKFNQTKKQLFQAKRKIDDLEDEVDDLRRELDEEKLKKKENDNNDDDMFTMKDITDNLETIEFQTEIASLTAEIAKKEIEIDELNMDNDKWQEAHDSIFERMTEAQTRLAKEIEEFEDAKKFYENKLSVLRDQLQDNCIHFWEYEKRINEITKIYEQDTNGKQLEEWENKPNIKYNIDETSRVSIIYGNIEKKVRDRGRDSIISISGNGWGNLSPHPSNKKTNFNYNHSQQDSILYDIHDDEDDEDDEGHNNAFGIFDEGDNDDNDDDDDDDNNNDDQFGCDEDDDGVNAFGAFGAFGGDD